jgi:hypothetical protein
MSELLPDAIKATLPKLYAQERVKDPIVHLHFYATGSEQWHWYITEGSVKHGNFMMFAWVVGWENELGYVSLVEMESVNDHSIQLSLPAMPGFDIIPGPTLKDIIDGNIIRDEAWTPKPLSAVKKLHGGYS